MSDTGIELSDGVCDFEEVPLDQLCPLRVRVRVKVRSRARVWVRARARARAGARGRVKIGVRSVCSRKCVIEAFEPGLGGEGVLPTSSHCIVYSRVGQIAIFSH